MNIAPDKKFSSAISMEQLTFDVQINVHTRALRRKLTYLWSTLVIVTITLQQHLPANGSSRSTRHYLSHHGACSEWSGILRRGHLLCSNLFFARHGDENEEHDERGNDGGEENGFARE